MKLSERAQKIEESATLAFAERVNTLRAAGADIIPLVAGEPDFDTPDHIKEAAIAAIRKGLTKYTASSGIPALKTAVVRKLEEENGLKYPVSAILVSCGAKHSIYNILHAVCNEGDEALFQSPYWTSYPEMVKSAGATPVVVKTTPATGFKMTAETLRRALTPKSKALIFNSPSNPTGVVYSEEELRSIAAVAVEKNLLVISDEIYEKLVYGGVRHVSIASLGKEIFDRTVVVNGVSKAYAMTGWRIGYSAGPREIMELAKKLQSQTTSNPTSIAQYAALAALESPQDTVVSMTAEFNKRRDLAMEMLSKIEGIPCVKPDGAFYLFPDVSKFYGKSAGGLKIANSHSFAEALLEKGGVAAVAGVEFGAENHIRFSFATSREKITAGMERLGRFLREIC